MVMTLPYVVSVISIVCRMFLELVIMYFIDHAPLVEPKWCSLFRQVIYWPGKCWVICREDWLHLQVFSEWPGLRHTDGYNVNLSSVLGLQALEASWSLAIKPLNRSNEIALFVSHFIWFRHFISDIIPMMLYAGGPACAFPSNLIANLCDIFPFCMSSYIIHFYLFTLYITLTSTSSSAQRSTIFYSPFRLGIIKQRNLSNHKCSCPIKHLIRDLWRWHISSFI